MAAQRQLGVDEYLRTSFDGPDCEYIDGEIVERSIGEKTHAHLQWRIGGIFYQLSQQRRFFGATVLRLRLRDGLFRIPDFAVYIDEPGERVPSIPPLLVIEIVSPDDRLTAVLGKLEEYRAWGVSHVWLIDPELKKLYVYGVSGLTEVRTLSIPELTIEITATHLFE